MAGSVLNSTAVLRLNFCAKLNICASISATSPSCKTLANSLNQNSAERKIKLNVSVYKTYRIMTTEIVDYIYMKVLIFLFMAFLLKLLWSLCSEIESHWKVFRFYDYNWKRFWKYYYKSRFRWFW